MSPYLSMLLAGFCWGFPFVAPVLVPQASSMLITAGRFVTFGLVALPQLSMILAARPPWRRAFLHALTGSVAYFGLLVSSVRFAGPTLAVAIVGLIPAVMAVVAARSSWRRIRSLLPALALMVVGEVLLHAGGGLNQVGGGAGSTIVGIVLAVAAVASWSWYGLDSHRLLRNRPELGPIWSSAQGLFAGLLSVPLLAVSVGVDGIPHSPARVVWVVCALGLFSSWLAVQMWNAAAKALPSTLSSQLLSVETVFGFMLAAVVSGTMPGTLALIGEGAIIAGCVFAVLKKGAHQ